MRLINTTTLLLHDFPLGEAPPYAILSHTWGDGEVSFQDMASVDRFMKKGYEKISRTCSLAREAGLGFAWIDTCCIDKSSSAELGESINSMFQWYMNAVVCYVSLVDLPPHISAESGLLGCRWFIRGWTLQELIAPKVVKFYDQGWNHVGTKLDFVDIISNFTGIPVELLLGRCALSDSSIATRMSWVAQRQTTRVEDMAYCLLGIFEVNMPLIYGEGMRAFRRLQEEIIKHNNDLTIFAWDIPQGFRQQFVGLFAPSPAAFAPSSSIIPYSDDFANFSVTNRGLYLTGDIPLRAADVATEGGHVETLYVLSLGMKLKSSASDKKPNNKDGGIYLRKIGPKLFYRDGLLPLAGFGAGVKQIGVYEVTETYILLDPTTAITNASSSFRNLAIHIPFHDAFHLHEAIPETLWDHTDRVFLRPKRYDWTMYPTVLAMAFNVSFITTTVPLVLLCDYRERVPILKVLSRNQYPRESAIIFQQRYREETISWDELDIQAPSIHTLSDSTTVRVGNDLYLISVSFKKGIVERISRDMEVLSLVFSVIRNYLPLDGY
jgi:hypothetical protein